MPTNVLVTGGAGFVGSYVVRALVQRDDNVVVYDINPPGGKIAWLLRDVWEQVQFIQGDVQNLEQLLAVLYTHRIEKVFHAAWVPGTVPFHVQATNVRGTLNVFQLGSLLGLPRVVFCSSVIVYSPGKSNPIVEDHPIGPILHPYAMYKAACEMMARLFPNVVTLRLSTVLGLGMAARGSLRTSILIESAVRGVPVCWPTGADLPHSLIYCQDVAQAVSRALDVEDDRLQHRIFNVASGEAPITDDQIAAIVRRLIPGARIKLGPGVAQEDVEHVAWYMKWTYSIERAQRELGYEPRYGAAAAIQDYVDLYQAYLAAGGI